MSSRACAQLVAEECCEELLGILLEASARGYRRIEVRVKRFSTDKCSEVLRRFTASCPHVSVVFWRS